MNSLDNHLPSITNRFVLRSIFLYLILYIFPYGFEYVQELNTDDISFWKSATIWFGESFLGFEMNPERLRKGFDSQYDYSRFVLIALISVAGAFIWNFIDSKLKQNYNSKLRALTRTILRYHVGLTMILYGLSKVFMLQFGEMDLDKLESKIGDSNGMSFLWTFMSYSKFYTMTAGWIEVIGGVLLLFRKTTFIGSFIVLVSMVNVVLIDIGYDVRVKMFAIHLLLMTILLMSSHFKRMINFFLLNKATNPFIENSLFTDIRYKKIGYFIKGAILLYFTISCFIHLKERIHSQKKNDYPSLTRFHEINTHTINGETIPETDERRWHTISINGNSYIPQHLSIKGASRYPKRYSYTADTSQNTMSIISMNSPDSLDFKYEDLGKGAFNFIGTSSGGDTIRLFTKSKSMDNYRLSSNKIKWITDLKK